MGVGCLRSNNPLRHADNMVGRVVVVGIRIAHASEAMRSEDEWEKRCILMMLDVEILPVVGCRHPSSSACSIP